MQQIVCLGKNYAEHAVEMKERLPERPVIFLKSPASLVQVQAKGNATEVLKAQLPNSQHGTVQHEIEVVFQMKRSLADIRELKVLQESDHFWEGEIFSAVTLGLDMTKRELQFSLKENQHPWTVAKVFPFAAIIGPWISLQKEGRDSYHQLKEKTFSLSSNGSELRQQATICDMLFSPLAAVQLILEYFPLTAGDILYTGTPHGVGVVKTGDEIKVMWDRDFSYRVQWN